MQIQLFKPALVAGFSFLVSLNATAQNYVDVEAERQAERRAREAQRASPPPQQPSVTPLAVESVSTGNTTPQQGTTYPQAGDAYQSNDSYGGIRPYSGSTRVITPVTTAPAAVSSTPSNMGDMVIMLQQLEEDVRRLNGIVEEQAAALRRLEAQSLERYVDLDRRLAGGVGAPPPSQAAPGSPSFGPQDPGSAGTGATVNNSGNQPAGQPAEQAAYRAAYDLVRNRQFDRAVTAFQAFLAEYPFGQYAPNAHYWLGELYLVISPPDPELARQSFKLLLDQYPDNAKVPDAMYKLGRVHFLKGNRDRAREYLDRVIANYSADNHPAAQLARDFIAENF